MCCVGGRLSLWIPGVYSLLCSSLSLRGTDLDDPDGLLQTSVSKDFII